MPEIKNSSHTVGQTIAELRRAVANLTQSKEENSISDFDCSISIQHLLLSSPINVDGIEWDFDWHQGVKSIARRGFYKIVVNLSCRQSLDRRTNRQVPTWGADLIFSHHPHHHPSHFQFLANLCSEINRPTSKT